MQVIYIDNCAWDTLHKCNVDLSRELADHFSLAISAYGEIEIPDKKNPPVAEYARKALSGYPHNGVRKDFGFTDKFSKEPPDPRLGGFDEGYFVDRTRVEYERIQPRLLGGKTGDKRTNSGLLKNQTDIDYAGRSLESPVITANIGDYTHAIQNGGQVIDLSQWQPDKETFGDFLRAVLLTHHE
jgi:hypothetical protein